MTLAYPRDLTTLTESQRGEWVKRLSRKSIPALRKEIALIRRQQADAYRRWSTQDPARYQSAHANLSVMEDLRVAAIYLKQDRKGPRTA